MGEQKAAVGEVDGKETPSAGYLYLSIRACFRFYQTTKTERISEYIGEIWRNSEKIMVRNNNNNNNNKSLFVSKKERKARSLSATIYEMP